MSPLIIIFAITTIIFSFFIFIGITSKPQNTDSEEQIKNTVIHLNSLKCTDGGVVRCDDNLLGPFVGDAKGYCNSMCKESIDATGQVKTEMECKLSKYNHTSGYSVSEEKICVPSSEEVVDACSIEYGGTLAWTGSSNVSDEMGWGCLCNWPEYAGSENCSKINRNVCGVLDDYNVPCATHEECWSGICCNIDGNTDPNKCKEDGEGYCSLIDETSTNGNGVGTFDWSASENIPEDISCDCKDGYTRLIPLNEGVEICVLENDIQFYLDTYYDPRSGTQQ